MSFERDEAPAITVRRAAMNMLARREQTFFELRQKLQQKFPDFSPGEIILPAIEKLRTENLQSDQRFVESFVRYKATKGCGPLKIQAELRGKGVDDSLITEYLNAEEQDWLLVCRKAYEKKFADLEGQEPDRKTTERAWRFLSQRGFDRATIKRVLSS